MAFDMYLGDRREKVDAHEDYIFTMASDAPTSYPQLNSIRSRFYSSFVIEHEQANNLVHELLQLHEENASGATKSFASLVLRLTMFFSTAARLGLQIKCHGD